MGWFDDIKENTLVRVELNNSKEIEIYFISVDNGIVKGRLKENGNIKKFKEDKVEDLEMYANESKNNQEEIFQNSQKIIKDTLISATKQRQTIKQETINSLPSIKISFLHKIDNTILSPIEFKGKETLLSIKNEDKSLYSKVMGILNQFENAKRIKELDSKFGRTPNIIRKLNALLEEEYYQEIDIFLAYVLQESDVSYFESFRKLSQFLYCLKYDIYFFNIKNNKYGFIVVEQLFKLYKLDTDIENEWIYLIKNIPTFNSFKALKNQYDFRDELSENYQDLLNESINYIFNKLQLKNKPSLISEQIKFLEKKFVLTSEYKNLDSINYTIKNSTSSKSNTNLELSYNDFSSLGDSLYKVVQPNIEKELEKVLQPNGTIKTFFKERNYGFIESVNGITHYFAIQNVIDDDLLKKLQENSNPNKNIDVCFSTSYNYKGETANAIQKPKKINKILDDVSKYKNNGHYNIAQKVLEQILSQYPNNLKVKKIYSDLINTKPKQFLNNNKYENYGSYGSYRKAREAKDKKDYTTAIKYFLIALQNSEKIESTIKDLSVTYYEIGEIDKAKQLLNDYEDKLSPTITTYNFLENHYFALGEYNKALKYIDIVLRQTSNTNKEILLLGKKASCYIKLGDTQKAKEILENILMLQKNNSYAKNLLEKIKTGNLSNIDIDISSFGGGLSSFIEDTLTKYEDYTGIPPKIVESKEFTLGTLKEIRRIIDTAGRARPKERASYLLTEAKLMQDLEPDKDINQRRILARYCNAMALNHTSENSPKEVIRFYYLEAFNLEEDWDKLARQVSLYLLTYIKSYSELLNIGDPTIDKTLKDVFNYSNSKIIFSGLLDIFIWNSTITKHLIKRLFDNSEYKEKSISFLNEFEIIINNNINFNDYTKKWDEAREKQKRNYDNWFASIRSLAKLDNIDELAIQISPILNNNDKHEWLSQTDRHRLKILLDINELLNNYLKQITFDDKERIKNHTINLINELINEINRQPTKFSYEGYKPLLENIEHIVLSHFDNVLKESTPEVEVVLLGESVAINNKNVELQLSINNSKNSSPISNIEIQFIETNDIKLIKGDTNIYQSIRGGQEKIIKLVIEVSESVINNLATDIGLILQYNIRATDKKIERKFNIPVRLYSSDNFVKIKNVYAPLTDGGPVKDKSMFYGRDEYINNIINSLITSNSKSIIIYGQKRSGKSSVLHHLKESLESKENAFCINFSMGEIVGNLSSITLYDKILEKIEEELENLEDEGYEVPTFDRPNISEIEKYPESIFNDSLKKFNKSIKNLNSWKNKKLVILIDEFTYVYTSIEKGELNPNFMKSWKAFIEKNYFSAVLIGQDVAPKFKQKFPNEFGVTEDKRLTYLSEYDARKLIEEPIWDKERNSSRYIGKAIDRIIEYTACSPYYLQMFCARVVDYMNRNKAISVTEADIEEISNTFIEGAESLSEDKFDNLFTAGDADIEAFDINDVKSILIQIAKKSNIGSCSRSDINLENQQTDLVDSILEDLKRREVIEQKNSFYKIKVGLFKKWLLKQ